MSEEQLYEFEYRRGEIVAKVMASSEKEAWRKLTSGDTVEVAVSTARTWPEYWVLVGDRQ